MSDYNFSLPQTQGLSHESLPVWAWVLIILGAIIFIILLILLMWYTLSSNNEVKVTQYKKYDIAKMA